MLHDLNFPMTEWQDGDRVSISPHVFWPDGGTGTVRPFPDVAADLAGGADGCCRTFDGARKQITMVWVIFDSPLVDGDGDGHTVKARSKLLNSQGYLDRSHHSYYRLQTTASIPIFKFPNRNTAADQSDIKMDISQRLSNVTLPPTLF